MKLIYLLLFLFGMETATAYANGGIVCSPPKDRKKEAESKE